MHGDRSSRLFLAFAFAGMLVLFGWAYARSFGVMPAGDDWPIVVELQRGNHEGVHKFFTDSVILIGYRPLKSMVIWGFGNLGNTDPQRFAWIRLPHLLAAVGHAGVAVLWVRSMPLGKVGAVAVIAIMLLHPVLPQAAGSVDGVDTLASSALLWLGAWFVLRFRDRLLPAIAASVICFVVGVGFKENLFALVPLSIVVVLTFWRRRAWHDAILVGTCLGLTAFAMILVRFVVIRGGLAEGQAMIRLSPMQIAENATLFATALLLFGNSMWVYVNRTPGVLVVAGVACLVAFWMILWGIALRLRAKDSITGSVESETGTSLRRWTAFLLIGLVLASFPTILLYHVSEMYVPPMLLPFALLCGLAADGLALASFPVRLTGTCAAAAALVFSLLTIRDKIDGLVDVGQRAQHQLNQLLTHVPEDARDMTIAIRFLESDRRPGDLYAVFRMPDSLLLVHRNVLDWARPYQRLVLDWDVIKDFSQVDSSRFDLALGWDAQSRRFIDLSKKR